MYNQISGQPSTKGEDFNKADSVEEPYLNLAANTCNATNCVRCSREGEREGRGDLTSVGLTSAHLDEGQQRMSAAEFDGTFQFSLLTSN